MKKAKRDLPEKKDILNREHEVTQRMIERKI